MERLSGVAQKLQKDTRAERTKEVERELGLSVESQAGRNPELVKSVFQKLKQMFSGGSMDEEKAPVESSVIPPTRVTGQF